MYFSRKHLNLYSFFYLASASFLLSGSSPAQTSSVAAEAEAAAIRYAPQQEREPYRAAKIIRDIAYGARPRTILDVAQPKTADRNTRPVLMFVSGGAGNRIEVPGYLFYDNVMLWAVNNGFIGINLQRDAGPDTAWDTGAKNIGAAIAWAQANIQQYGGNPDRIFVWGHSSGATALATYISHRDYYPEHNAEKTSGLRGAILHSGAYNIAPIKASKPGRSGAQVVQDSQTLIAQSSLTGLTQTHLPLLFAATDDDPRDRPEYVSLLHDALCNAGTCPSTVLFKHHDHMSEIFSVNSRDQSVSRPILKWLRSIDR